MDMALPIWVRVIVLGSILMKMVFGVTLLVDPSQIAELWPWPLPPLTARLLGGSTLVSVPLAVLSVGVNRFGVAMIPFVMMATYRVLQLVAGVTHIEKFDLTSPLAINYFGGGGMMLAIFAYVLWAGHTKRLPEAKPGAPLADPAPLSVGAPLLWGLRGFAALYVVVGVVFLLLGAKAAPLWFDVDGMTPLTARLFASPLMGVGLGLFLVSRAKDWRAVMAPAAGLITIGIMGTLALFLEFDKFAPSSPFAWAIAATPLVLLFIGSVLLELRPRH
ncbi:MAG: hypothetical protein OEM91_04360 [Hyphomicrobiales bacterium]|nr:hypothetical protein [Hyphomicrobiales bacterium]